MLRTIRSKIVFGVLVLVLLMQIISSTLQSYQVQSIFFDEFILGAQNLSQSPFLALSDRIKMAQSRKANMTADDIDKQIARSLMIIQYSAFESILRSKDDLLSLQFVNTKGEPIAVTSKIDEGFEHKNKEKLADFKIHPKVSKMIEKKALDSIQKGSNIHIFVPYSINEAYFGGMVLTYSDERLSAAKRSILYTGVVLFIVFMAAATVIVIIFARRIVTKPIRQMIILMRRLAEGELDQRFEIENQDEIGEMGFSVNELVDSLQAVFKNIGDIMGGVETGDLSRQINIDLKGDLDSIKSRINKSISLLSGTISTVKDTSRSVENSAKELSKSADVLSQASTKQAATLEEISSSIAEIENHSKQNTEYSREAKQITGETLELVNKGNHQMEEMQESMNQINNTSQDVTKIIKVIDEIAFQTNLLALNAAVEAARAGKYGKGFAVVADEVRNLATRSAEAARNTADLIDSSMKQVEFGVQKADQTGSILKEIVDEVKRSNELVTKIAEASLEQSSGISEIYSGISQVNEAVQENSATAEETSSSSNILLNQSATLLQEIRRFKLQESAESNYQQLGSSEVIPPIAWDNLNKK